VQEEGAAWGADDDLMLDEEGNPEVDEGDAGIGGGDAEEGGWDVSVFFVMTSTISWFVTKMC
jgi:hypothetical protein